MCCPGIGAGALALARSTASAALFARMWFRRVCASPPHAGSPRSPSFDRAGPPCTATVRCPPSLRASRRLVPAPRCATARPTAPSEAEVRSARLSLPCGRSAPVSACKLRPCAGLLRQIGRWRGRGLDCALGCPLCGQACDSLTITPRPHGTPPRWRLCRGPLPFAAALPPSPTRTAPSSAWK